MSLETESVVVETIRDGEVLSIGDTFQVLLHQNQQGITVSPSSVDMVFTHLESSRSIIMDPYEISVDLLEFPEPLFSISDDFEDGKYRIDITVYESESILTEHSVEFVVFTGTLSGQVKNVFPLKDLYTNSVVILESTISSVPEIDPYLIWREGDQIISEGYLSEGLDIIRWNSGDTFGFVNIRLDMYPYRFDNLDVLSSFYIEFPFVVNPLSTQLVEREELQQYKTYFQFNGNYIDEADKFQEILSDGELTPDIYEDVYGMLFNSTNSFSSYAGLIPYGVDNELQHFSLITSLVPLDIRDGILFSSYLEDIELKLYAEEGILYHSLGNAGMETVPDYISELEPGLLYNIKINYIFNADRYNYFIYLNDELVGNNETYVTLVQGEESTETLEELVVGSSDTGFILDTLQIYFKDIEGRNDIKPNTILDVDYSESFQSVYTPIGFIGTGYSSGEMLVMNPDDLFTVELPIGVVDFDMEIQVETDDMAVLFNDSAYEIILNNSSIIKRRGSALFVNDEKIDDFTVDINSITLKANTLTQVDLITVNYMDMGIEAE